MLLLAILALTFIMFRYTMLNAEGEQIVVLDSYRPTYNKTIKTTFVRIFMVISEAICAGGFS